VPGLVGGNEEQGDGSKLGDPAFPNSKEKRREKKATTESTEIPITDGCIERGQLEGKLGTRRRRQRTGRQGLFFWSAEGREGKEALHLTKEKKKRSGKTRHCNQS